MKSIWRHRAFRRCSFSRGIVMNTLSRMWCFVLVAMLAGVQMVCHAGAESVESLLAGVQTASRAGVESLPPLAEQLAVLDRMQLQEIVDLDVVESVSVPIVSKSSEF